MKVGAQDSAIYLCLTVGPESKSIIQTGATLHILAVTYGPSTQIMLSICPLLHGGKEDDDQCVKTYGESANL